MTAGRADPSERLATAHANLATAVEALTTGEAWRRMLDVAARFPTYSANNVLLIGIQRPDATRVAGLRAWNSLDRRVRKGEKGIAILAPCLYRPRDAGDRAAPELPPPTASTQSQLRESESARQVRGFRVVHVFDLNQTEGHPLPEVAPAQLRGGAPPWLVDRLVDAIRGDGFTVERGPCERGANGHTDFATRTVRVRDDVDEAQAAKTLAHELGHIRADHEPRFLAEYRTSMGCRAQAEVEAESIAYLVAHAAGLPTESYSLPYLAGWSNGNPDLLRDAATRVIGTARTIVTDLDGDAASVLAAGAAVERLGHQRYPDLPGLPADPPAPEGPR
ncbi:MAG: ArdC-like ssDNA-binding domain-containing protein [Sporichthyaceae bacterium]